MKEKENEINISTVVGYILLTPPILGVLLFILTLIGDGAYFSSFSIGSFWSGSYSAGGGFSSTIPIYLGLMAIAGAYLIKEKW